MPSGFHTVIRYSNFVIGVSVGKEAAAFGYPFVKEQGIVDATIGNHPIAVFAAPYGHVPGVFSGTCEVSMDLAAEGDQPAWQIEPSAVTGFNDFFVSGPSTATSRNAVPIGAKEKRHQ